jgi:4-amino-4-deoxy-L-arabinose transferase-like glycosyltransferase
MLAGNLWYFTAPKAFSSRVGDHWFYLRTFLGAFFPWSFVVVGYALDTFTRRHHVDRAVAGEWLLFLWVGLVLAFFSLARFKLDWYIFPAAPACCVLAARAWIRAEEDSGQRWTKIAVVCASVVLVAGGVTTATTLFQIGSGA